jgi:hypothetical protein
MAQPSPTSFRQILGSVGVIALGFGFYSFFSGRDVPWGYQQMFGVVCAVLGGVFLLAVSLWPRSQSANSEEEPPGQTLPWMAKEETLLKQGAANRAVKFGNVGGWLYLTETRLVFIKLGLRAQEPVSIPLSQIVGVEPCLTLFIIPNSLRIRTKDAEERFVLSDRQGWVAAITKAKYGK